MNDSLIASLPRMVLGLGPVAGVSFRVASRMVNSLGAGVAVRTADKLDAARVILFHSSTEQFASLIETLVRARVRWQSRSLVFCDCECPPETAALFRKLGASVACLKKSVLPGRLIVSGCGPALAVGHRLAKELGIKAIELTQENSHAFERALTLGVGGLTPLIDHTASLLRQCGVRDAEAPRLAAALFEQTARDYARTGRQSWFWYQRVPDVADLLAQLSSGCGRVRRILGETILLGLEETGRHAEAAQVLRRGLQYEDTPYS